MPGTRQWCFGPFRLDLTTESLWRDEVLLPLPPKPFAVLAYLVVHAGQVVSKETLLDAVWPDTAVTEGVLKTCLGQIRQVLGETARTPQYIATLYRRGYRFVAPVVEHTEAVSGGTAAPPMGTLDLPSQLEVGGHTPALLPPVAERRHLTVLCCDLAGALALAARPDPEEYREVLHAYHQTCAEVMQRFDGYVAQYLSNGVLVYFGYPVAHEDDAQRAIRAGLALLDALATCTPHPALPPDKPLAVRLGVHTGLVVVDDVGVGTRHEPLALGETPNIALRLPALAAPNTLVISAATQQLAAGYFRCKALGAHPLVDLAPPMEVYHVLGASGVQSRLDVAALHGLTPLVGRAQEVALLTERWTLVTEGMGQVVLLTGEAGIGKSRLVQVLIEYVADAGYVWLECQGSPYYQHTALYPLIELLERAVLRFAREASPLQKLHKLEACLQQYGLPLAEVVPLFAALLSLPLPTAYAPLSMSPEQQKQHTLHALLMLLLRMASQQPLLLVMEDLHWVDPSTREWLSLLVDQGPTTRILALCTYRPDFSPPWTGRAHLTQVTVARLPQAQTTALTHQVAQGKALPTEVTAQIVAKTDGVPLFVEEVTKTVLESGLLQDQGDHYRLTGPLPPLAIPVTLHDSLLARLDRLGTAKRLAQLGATLGREFAYVMLQAVAPWDEATVLQGLHQLVEAELLYQRGLPPQATYVFKHALIQEAAYQSLLKRTRQQYHQQIAQVLVAQFPETVETEPELVAHHYTEADCLEQAVGYWQRAGERALRQSAHPEAVRHLTTALELLTTLPETSARVHQEVALQTALGGAMAAIHGFGALAVERLYARAWTRCRQLGDTPQLFPVLAGLRAFYTLRGELKPARELGEQLLQVAQQAQAPELLLNAYHALGGVLFWSSASAAARDHLEDGLALYDRQQLRRQATPSNHAARVSCGNYLALVLWHRGYPDQARRQSAATLALAHERTLPFSQAGAYSFATQLQQCCRDVAMACTQATATIAFCQQYGFAQYLGIAQVTYGWTLAAQGQVEAGLALMQQGLVAQQAAGTAVSRPYCLALLAEVYAQRGQPEAGLAALTEGLAMTRNFGEYWYEAELHRLYGTLLMQAGTQQAPLACGAPHAAGSAVPAEEAEAHLYRAWHIAYHQEAKSLELRAATSLARLWQQQGKRAAARELLAPIYDWFTEGFDTADLQEAMALLEALE
jgi:predicted ATPase/class 3 adenylate cyclase/DNA-binding winged helix-turn-helix (wHTH) protein